MSRKYFLLLKIQFLGMFGINKALRSYNKRERNRLIYTGLGYFIIAAVFAVYSTIFSYSCAKMGIASVLPVVTLTLCSLVTLTFTFIKSGGSLFNMRDYDMVMSLPVSSSVVIASRLSIIYLGDLMLSLIVILPSIVIYGMFTGASLSAYVMLVLLAFLAPLAPMLVAMAISVVITAFSMRFRYRNAATLVLSLIAFIGVMILSFTPQNMDNTVIIDFGLAIEKIMTSFYPPAALISSAVNDKNWVSFCLFALFNLSAGVLFITVISKFFTKINTAINAIHKKNNFKLAAAGLKSRSAFSALYRKEMRRLLSCTIYALNTLSGAIMLVMSGVAMLFVDPMSMFEQLEMGFLIDRYVHLVPFAMSFFVCISATTACALSLEGKNRWLMCSAPVETRIIFDSKIAVDLTFLLPASVFAAICFAIALKSDLAQTALMLLLPVVYSFFIAVTGMFINMKFPKYDWVNEQQAVKSTASVLYTLIAGFVAVIAPAVLCAVFSRFGVIPVILSAVAVLAVTLAIYSRLGKARLYI